LATTYYASITVVASLMQDVDNSGTASTSTDIIELRMGNGSYAPDRAEILKALERFKRWVTQGGTDQAGTNIPLPSGSA
jgi:hypothetical protein